MADFVTKEQLDDTSGGPVPSEDASVPNKSLTTAGPSTPGAPKLHDVVIKTTKKRAQPKIYGVPPEEIGIERAARSLADCNYFFHQVVTKTESELIDEGFDPEQIKAITEFTGLSDIETIERDTVFEHQAITGSSGINPAARIVLITEHYVRLDYEGTGTPSLYQVITGGDQGQVLRKQNDKGQWEDCITRFDVIPFASITPVPQPHRFFGRSVADLIMELQKQKTALKRGILDNIYQHNNMRMEIAESNAGPNTLDDLLVNRPGGIIRTKTAGGLVPIQVQDITASVYPALQYLDAELEAKTGLAKQTQGIDANALQNQSATAVAQVFSASQMRIKLIARVFAEGVKELMLLLHATIRKHGQQQEQVYFKGNWQNVDPRGWRTRSDMTINVGLGTGGKAQQFAQTMALANMQKELLMGGKANLVDDKNLYNTAAEITKIMGHSSPEKFFNDPSAVNPQTGQPLHPPVPPPTPPQVQIAQLKAQTDAQQTQQQAALDQQKAQHDAEHQMVKTQADIALQREKAQLEAQLALLDAKLKESADQRQALLHEQQMQHERELHAQKLQQGQMSMATTAQSHEANMASQNQKMAAETQKKKTHEHRDLAPVVEKLAQHFEAASRPKKTKARKLPDGSWEVESA